MRSLVRRSTATVAGIAALGVGFAGNAAAAAAVDDPTDPAVAGSAAPGESPSGGLVALPTASGGDVAELPEQFSFAMPTPAPRATTAGKHGGHSADSADSADSDDSAHGDAAPSSSQPAPPAAGGDDALIQLGNTDGRPSAQPYEPGGQGGTEYPINPFIEGQDPENSHPQPQYGLVIDRDGDVHQSGDWKPPIDSNDATRFVPFAAPGFNPIVPGELGLVGNHTYGEDASRGHTYEEHQQAEEVSANDPGWRSAGTDVMIPGVGRVFTVHFVCPGMNRHQRPTGDYTAGSTYDAGDRELVLSWGFGDRIVDALWIYGHYVPYSLSNGDGYDAQKGSFFYGPFDPSHGGQHDGSGDQVDDAEGDDEQRRH
jgi:hypothetical protein